MDIEICDDCGYVFEEDSMYCEFHEMGSDYTCKSCMLREINVLPDKKPVFDYKIKDNCSWKYNLFKVGDKYYDINKITLDGYDNLCDEAKAIVDRKRSEKKQAKMRGQERYKRLQPRFDDIQKSLGIEDFSNASISQLLQYNSACAMIEMSDSLSIPSRLFPDKE